MTNIIIVHGTYGNPEGNWFPWLKSELENIGCRVFTPTFPTPKNQSLESWLEVIEDYKQYINEDTIVVGHSLAPAFLLSVIETLDQPIKSAFLISAFVCLLGNPEFDELNKTFVTKSFNWDLIKKNCNTFHIINSDNDPYVPIQEGQKLAKELDVDLTVIKDGGHLNSESGYTEFSFLLDEIKKELSLKK
jgi:uncharacterized protein